MNKLSFSSFAKPTEKESKDDTLREKITYKRLSEESRYGLNIAMVGEEHMGKSIISALFGYFTLNILVILNQKNILTPFVY